MESVDSQSFREAFIVISVLLLISVVVAPFTEMSGSFLDLDGTIGMMDHADLWGHVNIFAGTVYGIGDMLCHQQVSRSLLLNGSQMPFCIRDVSMLIGLVAGLVAIRYRSISENRKKDAIFVTAAFVLLLTDWTLQYTLGLNIWVTRVLTGIPVGFALALLIDMGLRKLDAE